MSYFLRSQRLGFRIWSEADSELSWALWGDPAVTRLVGGPFDRAQVNTRLLQEIATEKAHGIQYWPIFRLDNGEHAGCCGLRPYHGEPQMAELGFHLRQASWGQGYGSESARAVIAYAFDSLGFKALFAGHHPDNQTSASLLQKLGFQYSHAEFYAPTGLNHPSYFLHKPDSKRDK